jgi:hypothetical protein
VLVDTLQEPTINLAARVQVKSQHRCRPVLTFRKNQRVVLDDVGSFTPPTSA